jgi:hypothetical protein
MNATDLDPNFLLPLWRALVAYFRRYQPLVQGEPIPNATASRRVRP